MILRALKHHAEEYGLVDGMEVKERLVHLVLVIDRDGSVCEASPWRVLTREVHDPKKNTAKEEVGRPMPLPEFPGVNAGGKANFLAESCDKVLGLNGKTGEPIADDGQNAAKAFRHFWQRIAEAHAATGLPELKALLGFRGRYLATEESRRELAIVGFRPIGRDAKPTFCALAGEGPEPLDKRTITFQVGAMAHPIFEEGSPLHDYWRSKFNGERFAEASVAKRGVCLVTGEEDATIADVHRTLIKGVPGLPPIGGYVVSFDKSTPSLCSFGFESGWNAPVSEPAAAAYAIGLNDILADEKCRRKFGDAVLCSWVRSEPELSEEINELLDAPAGDDVKRFFAAFAGEGRYHDALDTRHFHSLTLAANGGRVVVRRWLDEPLGSVIDSLKLWFADLDIEEIEVPRKAPNAGMKGRPRPSDDEGTPSRDKPSNAPPPLSIRALAATTARLSSEVQATVYDALYRAALERANPAALLVPVLQRLRIAAAQSGGGIRFHASRFALLKLILNRSGGPMTVSRHLCETNDGPYNCGRLLAVLDDLQRVAQGQVGADIVSRYYGSASAYPATVFPRLLDLAKSHRAKLRKDASPRRRAAGSAFESRINDICSLFPGDGPVGAPHFPRLLTPQEQGRFALGFHQQKAKDERDRREYLATKAAGDAGAGADPAELLSESEPE
jgi:CRISPR-associated protein Csd1